MFKRKFTKIEALVMAVLMVISVVSWDSLAQVVKADDYSADVLLGSSVYSAVDEMGQETVMGDILVRTSDDTDYISLVYGNESHCADVSDCDSFKLAWVVFDGYEIVSDYVTVTTNYVDSGIEPVVETYDITGLSEIEINSDYNQNVNITVDGLNFGLESNTDSGEIFDNTEAVSEEEIIGEDFVEIPKYDEAAQDAMKLWIQDDIVYDFDDDGNIKWDSVKFGGNQLNPYFASTDITIDRMLMRDYYFLIGTSDLYLPTYSEVNIISDNLKIEVANGNGEFVDAGSDKCVLERVDNPNLPSDFTNLYHLRINASGCYRFAYNNLKAKSFTTLFPACALYSSRKISSSTLLDGDIYGNIGDKFYIFINSYNTQNAKGAVSMGEVDENVINKKGNFTIKKLDITSDDLKETGKPDVYAGSSLYELTVNKNNSRCDFGILNSEDEIVDHYFIYIKEHQDGLVVGTNIGFSGDYSTIEEALSVVTINTDDLSTFAKTDDYVSSGVWNICTLAINSKDEPVTDKSQITYLKSLNGLTASEGLKITSLGNGAFKLDADEPGEYTIVYTDPKTKKKTSVLIKVNITEPIMFLENSAFDDSLMNINVNKNNRIYSRMLTAQEAKDGCVSFGVIVPLPQFEYKHRKIEIYRINDTGENQLAYSACINPMQIEGDAYYNSEILTIDGGDIVYPMISGQEVGSNVFKINCELNDNSTYNSVKIVYSVTIDDEKWDSYWEDCTFVPYDLNGENVTVTSPDSCIYSLDCLKNNVTVTADGVELKEGVDYKIYGQEALKVGNNNFKIYGMGNFEGDITKSIKIDGDLSKLIIQIKIGALYNPSTGKTEYICSNFKCNLTEEEALVLGTDATIDYGYVKSGENTYKKASKLEFGNTYYAKIIGKGKYSGTIYEEYTYDKLPIDEAYIVGTYNLLYTGNTPVINPTIMYKGYTLKQGVDYVIESPESYINPRAYEVSVKGIGNFTGSTTASIYIKPLNMSDAKISFSKKSYNWGEEPVPTVSLKGISLVKDVDYCVDCFTPCVGNCNYTIYSNYYGYDGWVNATVNFKALGSMSGAKVNISNNNTEFSNSDIFPLVSVELNGTSCMQDTEFTIEKPQNIKNAGKYNIVIKGNPYKGYTGTKTVTFTVAPASIENAEITVSDANYAGPKTTPLPGITLEYNGYTLVEGMDYTLSYGKEKNAGKNNTVKITGKGNFKGSVSKTYLINPMPIDSVDTGIISEYWTKNDADINLNLSISGMALNKDYTISVKEKDGDAVSVDSKGNASFKSSKKYVVTYTAGDGSNYTGSQNCEFEVKSINKKSLNNCSLSLSDEASDIYYNGYKKEPDVIIKDASGNELKCAPSSPAPGSVYNPDYEVFYSNNINAGKATVTAFGVDKYDGCVSKQFDIKKATPNQVTCYPQGNPYVDASGKVVLPSFELNLSYDYDLKEKEEYTYKVAKYKVAPEEEIFIDVTFKGKNFESGTKRYSIGKLQSYEVNVDGNEDLTITAKNFVYTGKDITPSYTIKYKGTTLKVGTDIKVKYCKLNDTTPLDKVINAGEYRIAIAGIGKYIFTTSTDNKFVSEGDTYVILNPEANAFVVDKADFGKTNLKLKSTSVKYSEIYDADSSVMSGKFAEKVMGNITSFKYGSLDIKGDEYTMSYYADIKPGNIVVTFSPNENTEKNFYGSISKTFTIVADKKINLSNDPDIIVTVPDNTAEITPDGAKLDMIVTYRGVKLVEGVDYKVDYTDNKKTFDQSKKQAVATVKGIGQYTGTYKDKIKFFVHACFIEGKVGVDRPITSSVAKAYREDLTAMGGTGYDERFVYATAYTGKAIKFDPKLKYNGKAMTLNKDYIVKYVDVNNTEAGLMDSVTDAGEYYCIICGRGNYYGEDGYGVKLFVIPADINKATVKVNKCEFRYNPTVNTVTFNGKTLSSDDYSYKYDQRYIESIKNDREIYAWIGNEFGLNYWDSDASGNNITDFYYAGKHKMYVIGTGNFCGVKVIEYTVNGIDVNKLTFKIDDCIYGNQYSSPYCYKVYYKGAAIDNMNLIAKFAEGTDPATAGTKTVIVKGNGIYTGTKKLTYKVKPWEKSTLSQDMVSLLTNGGNINNALVYEYTGKAIKPSVYIDNMQEGVDYTLSYSNNTNIASKDSAKAPTVTIKFKGNYSGSVKKTFSIVQRSVTYRDIVVNNVKAGTLKSVPVITVDGKKLANGKDFKCTYTYANKTPIKRNGANMYLEAGSSVVDKDVVPAGTSINVRVDFMGNYRSDYNNVNTYYLVN